MRGGLQFCILLLGLVVCAKGRATIETPGRCTPAKKIAACRLSRQGPSSSSSLLSFSIRRQKHPLPLQAAQLRTKPDQISLLSSVQSVNLLMLLFYASLGCVMPYLPVYYKAVGISDAQLGLLGAITPAVTFLVSPLWGALADTTGRHKQIMLLAFVGSVLARSALAVCKHSLLPLGMAVAVSAMLYAPVKPLLDSAALASLRDKSDYGRSRLYGQVGFGIGSFLVGPLLSRHLHAIFVVQGLLALPAALLMLAFHFPSPDALHTEDAHTPEDVARAGRGLSRHRLWKTVNVVAGMADWVRVRRWGKPAVEVEPPVHVCKAVTRWLRTPRVSVFFLVVFIIGVSSGVIENFAYVRLAEVACETHLCAQQGRVLGGLRLASSLAGGPMFWLSGRVVKALGINGVLVTSLLAYVLRFGIYASVHNPWHALPAELLRGVTFAMFWSAATYFVYSESPKHLTATMLGLLNGVYGGLGQSLGSVVGGELCRRRGIVQAFRMCAWIDLAIVMVFAAAEGWRQLGRWESRGHPIGTQRVAA